MRCFKSKENAKRVHFFLLTRIQTWTTRKISAFPNYIRIRIRATQFFQTRLELELVNLQKLGNEINFQIKIRTNKK